MDNLKMTILLEYILNVSKYVVTFLKNKLICYDV